MSVIDRDRWRELAPLLDQALELTDDERATWLEGLRARSPGLAAELAALLAGELRADEERFLEKPPAPLPNEPPSHGTPPGSDLAAYLQLGLGDEYVIEREIGGGAMSRVFRAHERALGRRVVVKVLPPLLGATIRAERFAREVRVAAALQHPNIVPLFTAGDAAGLPYYVMPYVEGESLRARLTREGRLPVADVLSVLRDVARALAFAHEHGIVHRDVKPENVLLAGDAAVVTDFGIARAVAAAGDIEQEPKVGAQVTDPRTLSAIGLTIGTPAYLAPEQVGDPRVDHRADLYAWGILAYELLAGQHPFADRITPQELISAHLGEAPTPLSRCAPDLSPMLTSLVRRCLEKEPGKRPQSAREILDTLSVAATPRERRRAARWRGSRLLRPAVLAVAGVLAVVCVALVVTTRGADPAARRASMETQTLAVLPFEDVGGSASDAYFGDGIAAEIATALGKAGGLRVASPTSVAAFRSTHDVDVRELGRRLGVGTVLEGRVRRSGDRMRLTVQLTSVADGMALWSDEYERQLKDVFQMQDEITRSIVGALRARFPGVSGPPPARPVYAPGTSDAEAYDLYLRGSYLLERRGVAKAVEYFQRAIAEDSTFARAYAGLAYALVMLPTFAGTPPRDVAQQTIVAAHHALALDSTLSEAYTALGLSHMLALRWQAAGEALERAVTIDPGFAPAHYFYGSYLIRVGRVNECEEHMRRARVEDPLSVPASQLLAYCLSLHGRYEESLEEGRRAYDLDSSAAAPRGFAPLALLYAGHPDEARTMVARVPISPPLYGVGVAAYVLATTGDRAGAAALIRELEARPLGDWSVAPALAYAYLGLGDTVRAFGALESAVRTGERPYISFVDPIFDPVRHSPRFAAVVRRLGLDERAFTTRPVTR